MIKTNKKKATRTKTARTRFDVLRFWLKRLGGLLVIATLMVWSAAWFFLSDTDERLYQAAHNKVIEVSLEHGFSIENILVEGRVHTDPDIILGLLNVQSGDALLEFDPTDAHELIEQVSWVKGVRIERRFPDTIFVGIDERVPIGMWSRNDRLSVIDQEGAILTDHDLKRFSDLIIFKGPNVHKEAQGFLSLLGAEPIVAKEIKEAVYIDRRRWDVLTQNGTRIKLPEQDLGLALRRLALSHENDQLLTRDLISIDLRQAEKIVVRTNPGHVQEYKAELSSGGI